MALAHCTLGKFLGIGCYYFSAPLDIPTFITRCLHIHNNARDPSSERSNCGQEMFSGNFSEITISTPFRDLLHAANLRHGTDSFTSPPKEGVLSIFSPLNTRRLRPGLNPRTWILKAITLPLDHQSPYVSIHINKYEGYPENKFRLWILPLQRCGHDGALACHACWFCVKARTLLKLIYHEIILH
jgi:hypothetical protein